MVVVHVWVFLLDEASRVLVLSKSSMMSAILYIDSYYTGRQFVVLTE